MKHKKYTKMYLKSLSIKSVSEVLLDFLVEKKVKKVFMLTGGAIAFVQTHFPRKDISYICVQHEQAGAMMADAYSRVGDGLLLL